MSASTDVSAASREVVFPGPDEIEGFWAFDKMHAPRPISRLSFDLVVTTLSEGFTKAQAEYDCPIMASNKPVNNYFYMSFHPVPDEAVIADRMSRYLDTLATKVPAIGKTWDEEWKPALREKNLAARTTDYSPLTNAELVTKLDEMTDHMRHMWWMHGHINFVLLSSSAFCDMYDRLFHPTESTESYQTLQGFHTRSVDASQGLWDLSRTVRASTTLRPLFETVDAKNLAAALEATPEGKAFRAELDTYLHEFGWRSDAVYDLADVPWREDPTIPLSSIKSFASRPDSDNPHILYEKSVKQREDLMAAARAKLADDPETLKEFETLYEAARYSFPVTEDHAFYIDQLGVAVFRRLVLAIGVRLVKDGVVDAADDVFQLSRDELVESLQKGGDRRLLVAERRASLQAAAQVIPPGALGTPPPPPETPDPFMDAVIVRLLGIVPPDENPDPLVIRGVAGSPGVYTGVARVVRSLNEAGELQDGEIMVCEMTLPPWVPMFSIAGAVVADVGGVLSHCAIVAREFDVPAVVGAQIGTVAIKTGQTITVDGSKGIVYLDGRAA